MQNFTTAPRQSTGMYLLKQIKENLNEIYTFVKFISITDK
jgi:hypothetical protein